MRIKLNSVADMKKMSFDLKRELTDELNGILISLDFYSPAAWKGIAIPKSVSENGLDYLSNLDKGLNATYQWLRRSETPHQFSPFLATGKSTRINRLLLKAAYPSLIKHIDKRVYKTRKKLAFLRLLKDFSASDNDFSGVLEYNSGKTAILDILVSGDYDFPQTRPGEKLAELDGMLLVFFNNLDSENKMIPENQPDENFENNPEETPEGNPEIGNSMAKLFVTFFLTRRFIPYLETTNTILRAIYKDVALRHLWKLVAIYRKPFLFMHVKDRKVTDEE